MKSEITSCFGFRADLLRSLLTLVLSKLQSKLVILAVQKKNLGLVFLVTQINEQTNS